MKFPMFSERRQRSTVQMQTDLYISKQVESHKKADSIDSNQILKQVKYIQISLNCHQTKIRWAVSLTH